MSRCCNLKFFLWAVKPCLTRYERYVELPQPLLQEGRGHVGVACLAWLPLVVATLDHRHLVIVSRDTEDSLGAQAVQSWGKLLLISQLYQVGAFTENLVCERSQDPWKTSCWELVLLNIKSLRQCSSKHWRTKDLESWLVNILGGRFLGWESPRQSYPLQPLVADTSVVGDLETIFLQEIQYLWNVNHSINICDVFNDKIWLMTDTIFNFP